MFVSGATLAVITGAGAADPSGSADMVACSGAGAVAIASAAGAETDRGVAGGPSAGTARTSTSAPAVGVFAALFGARLRAGFACAGSAAVSVTVVAAAIPGAFSDNCVVASADRRVVRRIPTRAVARFAGGAPSSVSVSFCAVACSSVTLVLMKLINSLFPGCPNGDNTVAKHANRTTPINACPCGARDKPHYSSMDAELTHRTKAHKDRGD